MEKNDGGPECAIKTVTITTLRRKHWLVEENTEDLVAMPHPSCGMNEAVVRLAQPPPAMILP
jgi:hypothetical protein